MNANSTSEQAHQALTSEVNDGGQHLKISPRDAGGSQAEGQARFVAMFLPQFHEDPSNNKWWGQGFTEWENVKKARPLFKGHQQPRLPIKGFYDLSNPDHMADQFAEADAAGIAGFAIYDYWYSGKKLLGKPLEIIRNCPDLKGTYSLAWANHSWTRSWTNRAGAADVLIGQKYAETKAEREAHYAHLYENFADLRYLKNGDGAPILQIYNAAEVAAQDGYLDGLRAFCANRGIPSVEISALVNRWYSSWNFLEQYDTATLFQPSLGLFGPADLGSVQRPNMATRLRSASPSLVKVAQRLSDLLPDRPRFYDYGGMADNALSQYVTGRLRFDVPIHPMACVGFDNSPRYGRRARILRGGSAEAFERSVADLASEAVQGGSGLVFINSWNEWGEGAHLQPDNVEGGARLAALARVIHSQSVAR
jgi:Glycosyltransferase WbsX